MNAIEAVTGCQGVRLAGGDGLTFALPGASLPPPETKDILGVRPSRIVLGAGDWRGSVISNRWLGDQAHVALEMGGRLMVAVADRRIAAVTGQEIAFGFAPEDTHLFDAASGKTLLHGLVPA